MGMRERGIVNSPSSVGARAPSYVQDTCTGTRAEQSTSVPFEGTALQFAGGSEESHRNASQDSRFSRRYSNPVCPEYNSRSVTNR
jgi:hypothetical protein